MFLHLHKRLLKKSNTFAQTHDYPPKNRTANSNFYFLCQTPSRLSIRDPKDGMQPHSTSWKKRWEQKFKYGWRFGNTFQTKRKSVIKESTTPLGWKKGLEMLNGRLVRGSISIRPVKTTLSRLIIQARQIRIDVARLPIATAKHGIHILKNHLKPIYPVCYQAGLKTRGFEKA